jgi:signal transduction histidine kinase
MDLVCKNKMPEKADKYIITIKQNINRQIRLVNNLLDITRINSGNIKLNYGSYDIVYLTKSIVQSIQPIANLKGILVNFSTKIDKKEITLDEEKFERILLNLLSNALKFTPSNKSINVKLYIKKYKNKNMVCISVQDEGIGIPKDKHSCIFERFGQVNTSLSRQAEGTGIGLHLVKLFVNIMGGRITIESEEGKGSNFIVQIPAARIKNIEDKVNLESDILSQEDSRLIQTAAIELSDIYL